jgi:two-component system, OmpR family, response regulator
MICNEAANCARAEMSKILVIEDDDEIARIAFECLAGNHHTRERAVTCAEAFDRLAVSAFDLIILDWNLPDGSGIEVLRHYRSKNGNAPILMLTGKTQIDDKEIGFAAGADDYLTKPFNSRELTARIQALLRRSREPLGEVIKAGPITLECSTCLVFKEGQEVRLLPKEFALLEFLMKHQGQIFSCEELLERVWASENESLRETVITTVNRLRNKIDRPGHPSVIETLRGAGYRIQKS